MTDCSLLRTIAQRRACGRIDSAQRPGRSNHTLHQHNVSRAATPGHREWVPCNGTTRFAWRLRAAPATDNQSFPPCCTRSDGSSWCQRAQALVKGSADATFPTNGKGCSVGRCRGWRDEYEWHGDTCQLVEWDPVAFCRLLGSRRLLFVGDSTMGQAAAALAAAVRWARYGSPKRPAGCERQILYGLSDTLERARYGANSRGLPWDRWVHDLGLQTRPDASLDASGSLQQGRAADVVVLHASAHIYGEGNFTKVLDHVAATRSRMSPHLPLIWMMGPAAGCGAAPLAAPPGASFWQAYRGTQFANWPRFAERDAAARAFWQGYGPRVSVLDTGPLQMRVDAHPDLGSSAAQGIVGDCLHLCEAALVRTFPRLVLDELERRRRRGADPPLTTHACDNPTPTAPKHPSTARACGRIITGAVVAASGSAVQ